MGKFDNPIEKMEALRRYAEERLHETKKSDHDSQTEHDTKRLRHELEVHQIELEMQSKTSPGTAGGFQNR